MSKKTDSGRITDALAIMDKMSGDHATAKKLLAGARVNAVIAQLLYDVRTKAGLSQAELAARVGTKQSVISRLEDADYEGHSLSMLQRIASVLGLSVEIRFSRTTEQVSVPVGFRGRRSKRAVAA